MTKQNLIDIINTSVREGFLSLETAEYLHSHSDEKVKYINSCIQK